MELNIKKKPPFNWGLFLFVILNIFHALVFILIFKDLKYSLLLLVEIFFFIYLRNSINLLIRFFYISFVIFLLNLFFNEGEIIFSFWKIIITKQGLVSGLQKSFFFLGLLFLTNNSLRKNKGIILNGLKSRNKKGLISNSINYFLLFIENISTSQSITMIIKKLIYIYKNGAKIIDGKTENKKIGIDFYIYKAAFFISALVIFFLKIK